MPKPRPDHEGNRSTLAKVAQDIEALTAIVHSLNNTSEPPSFGVSKALLRLAVMRCRIERLLHPDD